MQKTALALMIGASLICTISACQPKADTSEPSESVSLKVVKNTDTQSLIETSEPKMVAGKAIMAKDCIALNQTMQKIDGNSKIESIKNIQDLLRTCLPTASNTEVLELLKNYQAMYRRFLIDKIEVDDESLNNAIYELYYGEGLSPDQLKTLSPRAQYLIGLVDSDADVRIRDIGEGYFSFDHNLKAMAELFIPYLRKDQAAFIGRMAQDNQEIFWSDAAITTSFEDLIERAIFWDSYIQNYPNGYAIKDAKILLDLYQHALFFGSDNTEWTDYDFHEFTSPEYEQLMIGLAKRPESTLTHNARTFLKFMTLSDSERQQITVDETGTSNSYNSLEEILQVYSPWDVRHYRNCLNGIFCENDIAFENLKVSTAFAAACPSTGFGSMQLEDDLKVWGFDTEFNDKTLECEPLNLKDYSDFKCALNTDWNDNLGISFYNQSGWFKSAYANSEDCDLALKGHLAADNEKM